LEVAAPLPAVIRIERFTAAPQYNTTQIMYRKQPFSRDAYYYHKWRASPPDLTAYFIARDFTRSNAFKGVVPPGSKGISTHVLSGSVDEFYERDFPDRWEAVLSLTVSLTRDREPDPSRRLLFQRTYTIAEPCGGKDPTSVAEAMSLAMSRISFSIIGDVYREIQEQKRNAGN